MDVIDQVARFGEDRRADEAMLDRARMTLDEALAAPPRRASRTRRALVIGTALGATASVALAAVVVSSMLAPPPAQVAAPTPTAVASPQVSVAPVVPTPEPPAPVTASSILEQAATLAGASAGAALVQSGYLRVETRTEHLQLWNPDAEVTPTNATRADATAAWIYDGTYVTYIPADRSAEWVRVFEPSTGPAALYGPDAAAAFDTWRTQLGEVWGMTSIIRTQGGIGEDGSSAPMGSDAYYAAMPRDPAALLEWNGARLAEANTDFSQAFMVIAQDLELNAAPAELRAAMFRALGLIPGVEIVGTDGNVTTLSYRFDAYDGPWTETISVDTATGLVTGTTRTLGVGGSVVPDDVPNARTRTTITTAETAP